MLTYPTSPQSSDETRWLNLVNASDEILKQLWLSTLEEKCSMDMTRGKPSSEQLDLCTGLLSSELLTNFYAEDGTDCRNYGGLDGIPEAKKLFAQYLQVPSENVLIGGNSSLTLMHDTIAALYLNGIAGDKPWRSQLVKFLCPVPGYDRHFGICEKFGIEMIPVPMDDNGPDMEMVTRLVLEDPSIKGIWCVPKYSNPSGIVYSEEVINKIASMQVAAPDFRVFWDNAYQAHHLTDERIEIPSILALCESAGHKERVFVFGSTSKITFAGAGLAFMAASKENLQIINHWISSQTVGPDKINQLRHVRFFKNLESIYSLMRKHADIIRPKFDIIDDVLFKALDDSNICRWTKPKGGYFVSLTFSEPSANKGFRKASAKRVVALAGRAGVKLTPAGSTHPYGKDPEDDTLRIAPTLPSQQDIKKAMRIVALCLVLDSRNITIS